MQGSDLLQSHILPCKGKPTRSRLSWHPACLSPGLRERGYQARHPGPSSLSKRCWCSGGAGTGPPGMLGRHTDGCSLMVSHVWKKEDSRVAWVGWDICRAEQVGPRDDSKPQACSCLPHKRESESPAVVVGRREINLHPPFSKGNKCPYT